MTSSSPTPTPNQTSPAVDPVDQQHSAANENQPQSALPTSLSKSQQLWLNRFPDVWINNPNPVHIKYLSYYFAIFFVIMILVIAFAPERYREGTLYAYNCGGNDHSQICPGGVDMGNPNSVFHAIFEHLEPLEQTWVLDVSIFNQKFKSCPSAQYSLTIETSLQAQESPGSTPLLIASNETGDYEVSCFEDSAQCEPFTLIWEEYIDYSQYDVAVRFVSSKALSQDSNDNHISSGETATKAAKADPCDDLLHMLGDVQFTFVTINAQYTTFVVSMRFAFFSITLTYFILWLMRMKKTTGFWFPRNLSWGLESSLVYGYFVAVLLALNPFLPLEVVTVAVFFQVILRFFAFLYVAFFVFYWLVLFDWTHQICKNAYIPPVSPQGNYRPLPQSYFVVPLKRFFAPKLFISCLFALLTTVLIIVVTEADAADPVRGLSNRSVDGSIVVLSVLLVLMYLGGSFYVLYLGVMTSQSLSHTRMNSSSQSNVNQAAYDVLMTPHRSPVDSIVFSTLKTPDDDFLAIPILSYEHAKLRYRAIGIPAGLLVMTILLVFAIPGGGLRLPAFTFTLLLFVINGTVWLHCRVFMQMGKNGEDWTQSWSPSGHAFRMGLVAALVSSSSSSQPTEHSSLISSTSRPTSYLNSSIRSPSKQTDSENVDEDEGVAMVTYSSTSEPAESDIIVPPSSTADDDFDEIG